MSWMMLNDARNEGLNDGHELVYDDYIMQEQLWRFLRETLPVRHEENLRNLDWESMPDSLAAHGVLKIRWISEHNGIDVDVSYRCDINQYVEWNRVN